MNNHSLNHLHTTTAYKFEQNVFVRGLLIAKIFMLMKVYSRFSFSTTTTFQHLHLEILQPLSSPPVAKARLVSSFKDLLFS